MKKAIVIALACAAVPALLWCAVSVKVWSARWTLISFVTVLTSDTAAYVFVEVSDSERRLTLLQYIGAFMSIDPGPRTVETSYRLELFSYREPFGVHVESVALPGRGVSHAIPIAPNVIGFRREENDYVAWDGAELKAIDESETLLFRERMREIGRKETLRELGWNYVDLVDLSSLLYRPVSKKFAAIDAAPSGIPVHIEMRADPTDPSSKRRGLRSITVWMKGEKVFEVRESGI